MASDSTAGGAPADMPADADPATQTGTPSLAELMRTIEQLQAEKADMQDKYLRAAAESQNIRRRAQQDVEKERKFGIERFGRDVLSVADNLGRALELAAVAGRVAGGGVPGHGSRLSGCQRAEDRTWRMGAARDRDRAVRPDDHLETGTGDPA